VSRRYDAVIIGGGHNGLVAACYLAGAGLSVAVLERAPVVGGAAVTEELIPGFRVSTGSYVLSLMPRRILDDLDLWSAGLQYLARDPRIFVPLPDGTSLTWWSDPARLHAELAKISKRDADRLADYDAFIERAASVMDRYILRNPPSWAEVAAEFRSPADLPVFQKCFLGSAADFAEHFFESEKLQAVVAATGIIGTFRGPRDPGTGYVKLYHSMGMATGNRGAWTYVKGAMGAVTQALARVATARGAVIRTGAEVREIVSRDGRATGVVLGDGEEIAGASCSRTRTRSARISGWCPGGSCPTTTATPWRRSRSRVR
jgi:phytoene dehydrogenase-like protein